MTIDVTSLEQKSYDDGKPQIGREKIENVSELVLSGGRRGGAGLYLRPIPLANGGELLLRGEGQDAVSFGVRPDGLHQVAGYVADSLKAARGDDLDLVGSRVGSQQHDVVGLRQQRMDAVRPDAVARDASGFLVLHGAEAGHEQIFPGLLVNLIEKLFLIVVFHAHRPQPQFVELGIRGRGRVGQP
jgi:hypothetical protein